MPRQKKEKLKVRKDGRYRTVYHGIPFYGSSSDEAIANREAFKKAEEKYAATLELGPTIEAYAEKWIRTAKTGASEQTIREARIHLDKLTGRFGFMRFTDIKPSDLKELYSEEYNGLSDSYISAASQIYKALFDAAMDDGYCKINPARMKSARPHKGTTGSHRPITPEERNWILSYCKNHRAHPAVMAMLYAGIRPQEAKALNIDKAYDPAQMELRITDCAHIKGNQYKITAKGKTSKATRTIPVFAPLYNALKGKHGMLITSASGKPVTVQAWKSVWQSYVSCMETAINGCSKRWYGKTREHKQLLASGKELPEWKSFTVVPYDLRHSFCVMCRDNGVELNTCVHWMGHADAKMILKIYDTVSYERSIKEAEKLNQTLFQVQDEVQKTD